MPRIIPVAEPLTKMVNANVVQDSFYEEVMAHLPLDLSDELTQTLRAAVDFYTGGSDRAFVRSLVQRALTLLDASE